jgi:hypothetical protein
MDSSPLTAAHEDSGMNLRESGWWGGSIATSFLIRELTSLALIYFILIMILKQSIVARVILSVSRVPLLV